MTDRYFTLVLHSHIPYVVAHGSWPHGMDWLYEAAAETYLPLLSVFRRLLEEGISPQVNISFTPVLAAQLKDKNFIHGFSDYLKMKIDTARQDRTYFKRTGKNQLLSLAAYWEDWYEKLARDFNDVHRGDIINSYRRLQDDGDIEILTSAATHSYFPLLSQDKSIRHQVLQGKYVYEKYFGREPRGFWLPECGYRPGYSWKPPLGKKRAYSRKGVDEILARENIGYFFVDTHLLKGGETKGVYVERFPALRLLWEKYQKQNAHRDKTPHDPYVPYLAYPSELPFLVKDEVSSSQVWSKKWGYPGDGWYLEFHKKHFPGGLRYWRVTAVDSDLADKAVYEPGRTKERLEENASHFVQSLHETLKAREQGVVVALYDTELLGHWWFEGPEWLYLVLKKLKESPVKSLTVSKSLEHLQPVEAISLPEGSWGEGGFHWIWLNEKTAWIWEKIYAIEESAAKVESLPPPVQKRVLRQFYREKFLLESSDWPFLISTWSAGDYAEGRAAVHYERAKILGDWLMRGAELTPQEKNTLQTWEREDGLFEEIVGLDGSFV